MIYAIIAAAGSGSRMGGGLNKQFILLNGLPVLARSLYAIAACPEVDGLIIVSAPAQLAALTELAGSLALGKPFRLVAGGSERQYSVANALAAVPEDAEFILVHDGARPLVLPQQVSEVLAAARSFGAAGLAAPVKDTIKTVNADGFVTGTPDRSLLWAIQTPQAFAARLLRQAYAQAAADGYLGTDDASLVERLGVRIKLVNGGYENLKITTGEDVCLAEALLSRRMG
ncbi:MAG: 2-C-methyl-D-erythritol 4-phosphate cytidylyltransferase [Sporomusaceae bacterium]|nr:2-C-methyl-D-erythritol 4-phosphate cytidylyltransferase [Sporomusaceae bacterium]